MSKIQTKIEFLKGIIDQAMEIAENDIKDEELKDHLVSVENRIEELIKH